MSPCGCKKEICNKHINGNRSEKSFISNCIYADAFEHLWTRKEGFSQFRENFLKKFVQISDVSEAM